MKDLIFQSSQKNCTHQRFSFIGAATVRTLAAERHVRSTQQNVVSFGAFVDAHTLQSRFSKKSTMNTQTRKRLSEMMCNAMF